MNLLDHSRRVIMENQLPSGAYLACPTMPDYQFSWFRDGAYIAYAMALDSRAGDAPHQGIMDAQLNSAQRFHDWCVSVILKREDAIERTIIRAAQGGPVVLADTLNARYTPDGSTGPDSWPEFQLDGPGTWLWSLVEFVKIARLTPLPSEWARAVSLAARYLAALWQTPCYDYWEEHGNAVHISTLSAIFAGLTAVQTLMPALDFSATCDEIRKFVLEQGLTPGGELAKSIGMDMVDANLISVATPHRLFAPDDPVMQRTIARIERELHAPDSGIHRYVNDVYYGGGAWVLLALWLAWYYQEIGETARATSLITWAEAQADNAGHLPEQIPLPMLAPYHYQPWVQQRGPIARPLLWSHAKYIIVKRSQ